ncbi:MAG: ParA family protein [Gammaproteobacteria bacterium]
MVARIVAIINQKGGVGKTTTSTNLSYAVAQRGRKVTVIDLDPQGHLAVSLGVFDSNRPGIDEVMLGRSDIAENIIQVRKNLQLLVAGPKLVEVEQSQSPKNETIMGGVLRQALQGSLEDQDFVFIDCPPSSGLLVANALFAADEILIPMTSDYLALQGLSYMMGTIMKFEDALNKKYKLLLVMSRYVARRRITTEVLNTVLAYFPNQVLKTVIRETSLLAECPSSGETILEYRPQCQSAKDFKNLANDFIEGRVM